MLVEKNQKKPNLTIINLLDVGSGFCRDATDIKRVKDILPASEEFVSLRNLTVFLWKIADLKIILTPAWKGPVNGKTAVTVVFRHQNDGDEAKRRRHKKSLESSRC